MNIFLKLNTPTTRRGSFTHKKDTKQNDRDI